MVNIDITRHLVTHGTSSSYSQLAGIRFACIFIGDFGLD